ncbi:HK97 gp10 family phage protein [Streptomyces sp. R302]|uniref:HK97 gp10 family phage protein n=1 Tax=unclassified Streptomyces TaxID=2593676 RepID=UPI00145F3F97|nr:MULTISPECIES: HK97 gp10 family phage protein [unclassified Streptomyces]NML55401.1 HK97 gp10 family phage protein [Streptomyces sp. R301]NML80273.1 HK97 gp10 family phage protein [Streptomyces sp. R302]
MAARVRPSYTGIGKLLRSEMIRREMVRRAELIKATAESIAPVGGPGDPHRGLYQRSFGVTSTSRGGRRRDRAVAYVTNAAPYARWVEYGTERVPAYHVLLRAASTSGGG